MGREITRGYDVQRSEEQRKEVKIGFWNVAGLGNKDRDFWITD